MATTNTSQLDRVASALARSKTGATVEKLAKSAKIDKAAVYRRVYDLRKSGAAITSNTKTVKGRKTTVYQVA